MQDRKKLPDDNPGPMDRRRNREKRGVGIMVWQMSVNPADRHMRVVVGFSGGVTSAWCAGWALRTYSKEQVVLLFHDTKEEDADTYRFLIEMAVALDHPITERSDGRNLEELCLDVGILPNNLHPFCSQILKAEPGQRYVQELRDSGISQIIRVWGFSAQEPDRIQRYTAYGWRDGYSCIFPLVEQRVTKQQASDWVTCEMGVRLPAMYEWSDHANCVGCARGGKAYMLAVKENRPEVFAQRKQMEQDFNFTFNKRYSLVQIETEGLKRAVGRREAIDIGPCECGG